MGFVPLARVSRLVVRTRRWPTVGIGIRPAMRVVNFQREMMSKYHDLLRDVLLWQEIENSHLRS